MSPARPVGALGIGQFSSASQLTARALRHYDEVGILRPGWVDPSTGYRFYLPSQLAVAGRIRLLRQLDCPLETVTRIIACWDQPEEVTALLSEHRQALSVRLAGQQGTLAQLEALLRRGDTSSELEVNVRTLDPEPVAVFRHRDRGDASLPGWGPFARLTAHVAESGSSPLRGIGLANAYDWPEMIDLDLGYVTDGLIGPAEGISTRVVDGGRFACVTFSGYRRRAEAYATLTAWMAQSDAVVRGASREYHPLPDQIQAGSTIDDLVEAQNNKTVFEIACPIS